MMTKEKMEKLVNESIDNLKNNNFNLYFFVLDTKGNPSSSLEYIYKTALILHNKGYKVTMLHQEDEFVGVGDWLGDKYDVLPHKNISKDNVEVSISDFLFIPEIFGNVIAQTKNLNCKKVMIIQNYNHIAEFLPISTPLEDMGIIDAVVTTKVQEEKIKKYFPHLRTHVVHPSISKIFRKSDEPQDMAVNLICKDSTLVSQIVKPFYWANPLYRWVTFRDLRGMTQEGFAAALRKSAITVWIDDSSNFGTALLEAMRSGGIVMAKVPDHPAEWMLDNGEMTKRVIWFDDIDCLPDMLVSVVRTWTYDKIPQEIYDNAAEMDMYFTDEIAEKETEEVYVKGFIGRRLSEFEEVKKDIDKNILKFNEE